MIEAYDMTLEAVVTKLMWILGQTSDPEEIREKVLSYVSRHMIAEAELTGTFTIKK